MSHWPNKYVIGLTGNIAVGKSIVRQMLQHLGAYTIDADGLVHQAMAPGAPAYKPIVQTFGELILDAEKRINRATLGSIVFSNPQALARLEAITHPIVRQGVNILTSRAQQKVIVIEAIKLLEGELAAACDEIWVVNARPETQYQRLLEKRKMSPEEAKKRILAQGPQGEKLKRATVVIENNTDIEETWRQVQNGWNAIAKKLEAQAAQEKRKQAQDALTVPTRPEVIKPPQQPAPKPAPTPTPVAEANAASPTKLDTSGLSIKRGMPTNAQGIADFITAQSGQRVERMDVMLSFGQKSYFLAMDGGEKIVGLMGWQVENLITRIDEYYVDSKSVRRVVIHALIRAVEAASHELQSEVGFVFTPQNTEASMLEIFKENGYEPTTVKDIKIPAWREAIQDANVTGALILQKQLRKDRVLTPI